MSLDEIDEKIDSVIDRMGLFSLVVSIYVALLFPVWLSERLPKDSAWSTFIILVVLSACISLWSRLNDDKRKINNKLKQ